jgi:hypothetical protein
MLAGRRVHLKTDCQALEGLYGSKRCKSHKTLALLRVAHGIALRFNYDLMITHVQGVLNVQADAASRLADTAQSTAARLQALGITADMQISAGACNGSWCPCTRVHAASGAAARVENSMDWTAQQISAQRDRDCSAAEAADGSAMQVESSAAAPPRHS